MEQLVHQTKRSQIPATIHVMKNTCQKILYSLEFKLAYEALSIIT